MKIPKKKPPSEEFVKQKNLFEAWCKSKGYFPHSKYFEAWMEALNTKEND
jgi:hypothetical protein